jgi:hypothetical protein
MRNSQAMGDNVKNAMTSSNLKHFGSKLKNQGPGMTAVK